MTDWRLGHLCQQDMSCLGRRCRQCRRGHCWNSQATGCCMGHCRQNHHAVSLPALHPRSWSDGTLRVPLQVESLRIQHAIFQPSTYAWSGGLRALG